MGLGVDVMQGEYSRLKNDILEDFARLQALCAEAGNTDAGDVAARLVANINAPFLFVVVGEVKSGKSSFINALLRDQVAKVAPDPCTDAIQKIVYAPEMYVRDVGEHVREVGLPNEILKEIAVVDTPGTNSIIELHQEITERFIPESDLVIFVFPALNPYAKTSWDFFQFVHQEWHKKIIFVLQQSDRATPEELEVNEARVAEYARERHVEHPLVFRVSARMAWEDPPKSGMDEIWGHIRDTVTGGRQYVLKLQSLLSTAMHVLDGLDASLTAESSALAADQEEAVRIEQRLRRGKESSLRDTAVLQGRLVAAYARLSAQAASDFEAGLSLANLVKNSVTGVFTRKNAFKGWVEELNARFAERLQHKVNTITLEATGHITENIVYVVESLLDELKGSKNVPHGLSVGSGAQRRLRVIDDVIANLFALLRDDSLSDRLRPQRLQRIGDGAVLGGLITTIGAVIAATAHAVVFDITGGVFTTLGALLAINTLAFKRLSIIASFKEGFEQGRIRFEEELGERLASQVEIIYADLEEAFRPFLTNISERQARLDALQAKARGLREALSGKETRTRELTGAEE